MEQTLEQLKAENAAQVTQPEVEPQTTLEGELDTPAEASGEVTPEAEGGDGSAPEVEVEDWMKGDDQESQGAEKKFTDHDVAAAKKKLRARIEQKDSEIERLQRELEEERRKSSAVPQVGDKPTIEQFYETSDTPEADYARAMVKWELAQEQAKRIAQEQQYQQQRNALEQQQRIETSVDQHYERAHKLAEASGITPELYQSADRNVREAVEAVFPNGGGEVVTNALIANMGEGSEKVFYHLGVNQARRTQFQTLLKEDPTGLKASVYLGKLSAELSNPARKTSNAPKPATQIQGDRQTTEAGRALHQKYKDAHKSGDIQKAISIKREARAAGADTQNW